MAKKFIINLIGDMIRIGLKDFLKSKTRPQPKHDHGSDNEGQTYIGRCYRVIDGDILYIDGVKTQIRLWGVDAPEVDENNYAKATKTLVKFAKGETLKVLQVTTDKYGRIIGRCFLPDGREINELMIASGTTLEYCRFTKNYYGTCS